MRDFQRDFEDFGDIAYLNCAYHGAVPRRSAEAVREALKLKTGPFRIRDEMHFTFPDRYRQAAARLVGAEPHQVAVSDSTIHGISTLTRGLDWRAGDEIVLPAGEFPSNRFPWLSLREQGVLVHEISLDEDHPEASLLAAINDRTRVLTVGWVHYSTGRRLDIDRLSQACSERDILFVVDATQGLGGIPFDLADTPCDLLACSGYKWLLGPYGMGFAVYSERLLSDIDSDYVNWFAIEGASDFNRLADCGLELETSARRFDIHETANFLNTAAATASLDYLDDIGTAAVYDYVQALLDRLIDGLPPVYTALGRASSRPPSNILCVAADDPAVTADAHRRLGEANIVTSLRQDALRISPHLYNTNEHIARLLEVLHDEV